MSDVMLRVVRPPACDNCGRDVESIHCDGTATLCGSCCREIAASMPASAVAPADVRPIRLVGRRIEQALRRRSEVIDGR